MDCHSVKVEDSDHEADIDIETSSIQEHSRASSVNCRSLQNTDVIKDMSSSSLTQNWIKQELLSTIADGYGSAEIKTEHSGSNHPSYTTGFYPQWFLPGLWSSTSALVQPSSSYPSSERIEKSCAKCRGVFDTEGELRLHLVQSQRCQKICENMPSVKEPYQCGTCHKTFSAVEPLKGHVGQSHENYAYECSVCSKIFRSSTLLVMHITESHDIPKAYKCGLCDAAFYENLLLLSHLQDSHGEQLSVYRCAVCKERYKNITSLNTHVSAGHFPCSAKEFQCSVCHTQFDQVQALRHHIAHSGLQFVSNNSASLDGYKENMHGLVDESQVTGFDVSDQNDFRAAMTAVSSARNHVSSMASSDFSSMYSVHCHRCDGRFDSIDLLSHHIETGECDGHQCPRCKKSFGLECSYLRHMAWHKVRNGSDLTCEICKKHFPSRSKYMRHAAEVHTTLTPFSCKICLKTFASPSGIQHHLRHGHALPTNSVTFNEEKESAAQMLAANTMTRSSSSDSTPESHVDVDINDKSEAWHCSSCKKTFQSSKGYQSHMHSCHSFGMYSAMCHKCNGVFDSVNALSLHVKVQKCEGFKCSQCGRSFALEDAFLRHVAGHGHEGGLENLDCELCGKRMGTVHQYKLHAGNHATLPALRCNICEAQFVFPGRLYDHLETHKFDLSLASATSLKRKEGQHSEMTDGAGTFLNINQQKQSYCSECKIEFRSTKAYWRHRNTCHFGGYYFVYCHACSGRFESLKALALHISETQCEGYKCAKCSQKFGLEYKYLQHMAWHRCKDGQTSLICDVCGKNFPMETTYIRHFENHTTSSTLYCALCPSRFSLPCTLFRHLRTRHGSLDERPHSSAASDNLPVEKNKSVNVCETTKPSSQQVTNSDLIIPEKTHHKYSFGGAYLCNHCGRRFSWRSSLETHIRVEHDKNLFECRFCSRKFRHSSSLFRHELYHGEKQFQCRLCDMSFYTKDNLRKHTVSHSTAKPYQCPVCKMRFKRKQIQRLHMVCHDPVKRYQCDQCDKAFKLKNKLAMHKKLHLDKREFRCHICTAAFNIRSYLEIHLRTHTNERPYQCPGCDKSFALRSNRNSHLKRMHPHINIDNYDAIYQQTDHGEDIKTFLSNSCAGIHGADKAE